VRTAGTVWIVDAEPRSGRVSFAGHDIAYRVAGRGAVLVLVKPHRYPRDYRQLGLLSDRYRVIQVEPLGFGASDRPHDYPDVGIHEQILAVADREAADRFVVWGYSQGGAMAAMVARASPRAAGMIAGGFSLATQPTAASVDRMEREQRVPVAARTFWRQFTRFDWAAELAAMGCPRLLYAGRDDRTQAAGLRRTRAALAGGGAAVVEFDGLDHRTCNDEPAMSTRIVPAVTGWLNDTVGSTW
jgi:pimeloyl-ACP methyl ester carboxylesterase